MCIYMYNQLVIGYALYFHDILYIDMWPGPLYEPSAIYKHVY